MSVSSEQKNEIIRHGYKSVCCRRALLTGVLFSKGSFDDKTVTLSLEKREYADFVAGLIREFYNKDAEIFRPTGGGRTIMISFVSPSAAGFIDSIDTGKLSTLDRIVARKCGSCISAFLCGVFLASGRLSDPEKQFSLEFSLGDRAEIFADLLRELSLNPLISHKARGDVLYFRRGDEIESFYGHAGLNGLVFTLIETKIKSLARRESQRYLNCVTSNYGRMAAVSERQVSIISRLDELKLLSSLPEELEETARLKLRFPDLPLAALAAQMTPAISKSGLSHRLKKIEEVGARLLKLTDEK